MSCGTANPSSVSVMARYSSSQVHRRSRGADPRSPRMMPAAGRLSHSSSDCGTNMAMTTRTSTDATGPSARRRPLDPARLEELALAYVARFATSAAKLERYLPRKLRERGWDGRARRPISRRWSRGSSQLGLCRRRGLCARPRAAACCGAAMASGGSSQALGEAGIAEEIARRGAPGRRRGAPRRAGRWRASAGSGRSAPAAADRDRRAKSRSRRCCARAIRLDSARELVDAADVDAAEEWAAEAEETH